MGPQPGESAERDDPNRPDSTDSTPAESADRTRVHATVTGVVQGVGFRPFVYRRATERDLGGSVRNTGEAGVEVELEGTREDVDAVLEAIETDNPPLSRVESIDAEDVEPLGERTFRIADSTDDDGGSGTLPPDTGICDRCLADVRDPDSRYHRYWATSCVDCGPRYTVVRELPYDRPRTSMDAFPMCDACREEYEDPADRRYHAQTIACPDCGPSLALLAGDRAVLARETEAIRKTAERLARGEIVAIRGIGGTHLACDATDLAVVDRLRERTRRPAKPFALMASSIDAVTEFARVSDRERDLLRDTRRPIVALDRRTLLHTREDEHGWLDAVAPGLHTVGVMLPYAGLHHLLFDDLDGPLVMTSANYPGKPMCTTTDAIVDDLADVIDAALVHDREIVARCDDSVVRVVDGDRRFLRRSRGWVPVPLPRRIDGPPVLALGGEFDATVAIASGDEVVLSQHLGDVDDPSTERFLRQTIDHLSKTLSVEPSVIACDSHPAFLTTAIAERLSSDIDNPATEAADNPATEAVDNPATEAVDRVNELPIRVQHHHAHAASLLAEHGIDEAIVVAADGTGYGSDGTIWGGEVLAASLFRAERVGGLGTFHLPGGEAAIVEPGRILASLFAEDDRVSNLVERRTSLDRDGVSILEDSLDARVNAPETTSAGRFLDAVSALLGVCTERRYQGEPAMRLESVAAAGSPLEIEVRYDERDGNRVVDVSGLATTLVDLAESESTETVAATAQHALARGLATLAVDAAIRRGVDSVGFTGGVAYNDAISRTMRETVEARGLQFLAHEAVPPGDGGITYGQAVVASALSVGGEY